MVGGGTGLRGIEILTREPPRRAALAQSLRRRAMHPTERGQTGPMMNALFIFAILVLTLLLLLSKLR